MEPLTRTLCALPTRLNDYSVYQSNNKLCMTNDGSSWQCCGIPAYIDFQKCDNLHGVGRHKDIVSGSSCKKFSRVVKSFPA